ncbi:hypothetical protein [Actinomadura bangladeshensis]|uniref:hypothetical protein n=1 Tax=Actinomadura bangladeshensis TaxID=453573 RepID=UPI001404695E|nr:hypothetical protein [Actinomadura bangladeshensis]
MDERRERPGEMTFPASGVHRMLIRLRVPRFMADHAAALLDALLPRRSHRR